MSKSSSKTPFSVRMSGKIILALVLGIICSLAFGMVATFIAQGGIGAPQIERTPVYLENLDITYQLSSDGTMVVTERWETVFTGERTFRVGYRHFNLVGDDSYREITLYSVTEPETGVVYEFNEHAHLEEVAGFSAQFVNMDDSGNQRLNFEWYGEFRNETRLFEIRYSVSNAVRLGEDVADFIWQMVPQDFGMYVANLTARVILPQNFTPLPQDVPEDVPEEGYFVFGHVDRARAGRTNAEIGSGGAQFTVSNLQDNTRAEARVVMNRENFSAGVEIDDLTLGSILEREREWAGETFGRQMRLLLITVGDISFGVLLFIVAALLCVFKLKKYNPKTPKFSPDYYREPPQELSPAVMTRIYNYYKRSVGADNTNAITATILNLALKRHIHIEDTGEITITFTAANTAEAATADEQEILNLLTAAAGGQQSVTMSGVQRYVKANPQFASDRVNAFETAADSQFFALNYECPKPAGARGRLGALIGISVLILGAAVVAFLGLQMILNFAIAGAIATIVLCGMSMSKLRYLNEEGQSQYVLWQAFSRYMSDFSLIKEKEVPSLVIWEKYLMYATAMGIGKQVLRQMRVAYPQLSDDVFMSAHMPLSYLWLLHIGRGSFNTSIGRVSGSVSNVVSTYTTALSAGSGGFGGGSFGGGGFSGGGGFGGGGGGGGFR